MANKINAENVPQSGPESISMLSDADLLRRAQEGNRLAAERLLERHRQIVFRVASRALGNAHDAHDVTQEVLMYALLHLKDVRDGNRLTAYLPQVTLTLCTDYRRRRQTRRLGEPLPLLDAAQEEADYTQGLVLRQALSHLPDALRTALLLHYVGGWSLDEVADLTATPLNTVRSRLMAGKRRLQGDLHAAFLIEAVNKKGKSMSATVSFALSKTHVSVLQSVYPGARVLSVQQNPEAWMPFNPRVHLSLKDGTETIVDFREDIADNQRAALVAALERLGVPGPRVLHPPVAGVGALCELPRGENVSLWALGGTPHRLRLASERAFQGIDLLQSATDGLMADPVGTTLPRRTLMDEVNILVSDDKWHSDPWLAGEGKHRRAWLDDPWFSATLKSVRAAVADIAAPLVYTDYAHFFPQSYRIAPEQKAFDQSRVWQDGGQYQDNPLVEIAYLFGHFGDPLLGLSMVWVYDCYPFVHTGFVEEFLWRRDVSRREFAPRLALKGLQMIARDLPIQHPNEGGAHWERLRGWVEQAISWM